MDPTKAVETSGGPPKIDLDALKKIDFNLEPPGTVQTPDQMVAAEGATKAGAKGAGKDVGLTSPATQATGADKKAEEERLKAEAQEEKERKKKELEDSLKAGEDVDENTIPPEGWYLNSRDILSYIPQGEREHFRFSAQTDDELYRQLRNAVDMTQQLIDAGVDNENIRFIQQMAKRLLTNPDGSDTALKVRGENTLKLRENRRERDEKGNERKVKEQVGKNGYFLGGDKDKERIFRTTGSIIEALSITQMTSMLELEALGQRITAGGTKAIEAKLPPKFDITVGLEKTVPHLGKRTAEAIKNALVSGDDRALKIILAGLGGTAAIDVLGAIAGFAIAGPPGAIGAVKGMSIAGASLTALGAGVDKLSRWDFIIGKNGDQITLSINTAPNGNRVITEFAKRSPVLGMNEAQLKEYFQRRETVLNSAFREIGINIDDPETRAGLTIDTLAIDPSANTVSRGVGLVKFINERQLALTKILESRGATSLLDLSPEARLEVILESFDTAARRICKNEAAKVRAELDAKKRSHNESNAESLERKAQDLESGKTSLKDKKGYEDDKKTKQRAVDDARKRKDAVPALKANVIDMNGKVSAAELEVAQAQQQRTNFDDTYDKLSSPGQKGRYSKLVEQRQDIQATITRTEGDIKTHNEQISEEQTLIDEKQAEIDKLQLLKQTDSRFKPTNPNSKPDIEAANNAWNEYQAREIQPLIDARSVHERRKKQLDRELREAKESLNGANSKKTSIDAELNPLQKTRDEAYGLLGPAQRKLDELKKQRDKILGELGLIHGTIPTVEQLEGLDIEAQRKLEDAQEALTKSIEALNEFTSGGTGKATEEEKQKAQAIRVVARLIRPEDGNVQINGQTVEVEGRFNTITGNLVDGDEPLSTLSNHENFVRYLAGPNASAKEIELLGSIATEAEVVLTAIDTFRLDPDKFFVTPDGKSLYGGVRAGFVEIQRIQGEINDLNDNKKAGMTHVGTGTWDEDIVAKRSELIIKQGEVKKVLKGLYPQVTKLLTRDPWEARDFTDDFVHRLARKAQSDPFALVEQPAREVKVAEVRGTTVETPVGPATFEASKLVGNVEEYHAEVRLDTTSAHIKPTGKNYEVQAVIDTKATKPEGQASNATLKFSVKLTPQLYADMDPIRPVHSGLPVELANVIYDGMTKRDQKDLPVPLGSDVQIESTENGVDAVLAKLSTYTALGDLSGWYQGAIGRLILSLDQTQRNEYFKGFTFVDSLPLGVSGNKETFRVARNPADGSIVVSSTGITTSVSLSEFIEKFDDHFKRAHNIAGPLNASQEAAKRDELESIIQGVGKEALKSMFRY